MWSLLIYPILSKPRTNLIYLGDDLSYQKNKTDVCHFECNFPIDDNEPKTRRVKGKEPAKWQSSIVYSNSFFSNYQYQNREKACHISKQECYTIITDSKGKEKKKKKRQNVIREQTRKRAVIYCKVIPVRNFVF